MGEGRQALRWLQRVGGFRLALALAAAISSPSARADILCSGDPASDNTAPVQADRFQERVLDGLQVLARTKTSSSTQGCGRQGRDLQARLKAELVGGAIVLLGEVHDNTSHHIWRSSILRDAVLKPSGVVFEHIRADRQPALETYRQFVRDNRPKAVAAGMENLLVRDFFRILDWDNSGWPDSRIFEPLFNAAILAQLPIYPGDLPRETMRQAAKEGESAIPAEERARLELDAALEPRLQDALLGELEESHCGLMPKTAFAKMAFAQRLRDAHLADAVLAAAATHGSAILLAGNGHLRTDRGVPFYLRQRAPGRKVVSVMLIEVEAGKSDPQAYVPRDPDGKPAADFIGLTQRQTRPDPCAAMRDAMKTRKG